jgi:hypothetical protein
VQVYVCVIPPVYIADGYQTMLLAGRALAKAWQLYGSVTAEEGGPPSIHIVQALLRACHNSAITAAAAAAAAEHWSHADYSCGQQARHPAGGSLRHYHGTHCEQQITDIANCSWNIFELILVCY